MLSESCVLHDALSDEHFMVFFLHFFQMRGRLKAARYVKLIIPILLVACVAATVSAECHQAIALIKNLCVLLLVRLCVYVHKLIDVLNRKVKSTPISFTVKRRTS